MLTPLNARRILWCLRSQLISAGRNSYWSDQIRSEKLNCALQRSKFNSSFFLILKFLEPSLSGMTASTYSIHSDGASGSISSQRVWQIMIVISFPRGCTSALSDYSTWTKRHRVVQSLTKVNKVSKVGDCSRGGSEVSLFNSYNTTV